MITFLNSLFTDGVLTLKGEKKSERDEKTDDYHLMERSYGSFQRAFRFGDGIDPDKVYYTPQGRPAHLVSDPTPIAEVIS